MNKLPPDIRTEIEELVFKQLPKGKFNEQYRIEKMYGYPGKYQIRTGNLRFGFTYDSERKEIVCERIAHRKDIYKLFDNILSNG